MIKDSGERTEFTTGAVRDMHEGKGDMASLPFAALLRLSKHYEAGAKKYGRWNYTKGILVSSFMDSALRHIVKYMDGQDDEDHLAAAAFNILGAMEMEEKHPELIDVPTREGKEKFSYYDADEVYFKAKVNMSAEEIEEYISKRDLRGCIVNKSETIFRSLGRMVTCLSCKHLHEGDKAYFCDAELTANVPQYCPSYEEKEG